MSLSLAACGGELPPAAELTGDELGELTGEIIGGQIDTGDPAVVMVGSGCSGTLVGPRTVLTARHCGSPSSVGFGSVASALQRVRVVRTHPNASHDIALLQLERAVTDVTPVPINTAELAEEYVGEIVRHVGFGIADQGDFGTKRQVSYPVRSISATELESGATGKQTCNGDSGGPALMITKGAAMERVVGTVSYGDAACRETGFDARVDIDKAWILATAAAWEPDGLPTGEEGGEEEDTTPPTAELVSPQDGDQLAGNRTMTVVARATDDVGVQSVALNWLSRDITLPCDDSTSGVRCQREGDTYTWSIRVGAGERRMSFTATDAAGNRQTTPIITVTLQP